MVPEATLRHPAQDVSKSTFLAIKAPLRSSFEIPDPNTIAQHYRALGYEDDTIKKYQLNIKLTKQTLPLLTGNLLGLVQREEKDCGLYQKDDNYILEQNVVHFYVIENGKILSGQDFRDKSLSNYNISI